MTITNETKTKIIKLIEALHPTVEIYLFGSFARGTAQPGSDIDLALDAGHPMDILEVGEIREILNSAHLPHKVDVLDIHSISPSFKQAIISERVPWKKT